MNTNDRGQNLAEARHFKGAQASLRKPAHGGHPDPRCACAGTGWVADGNAIFVCPDHADPRGPVSLPRMSDPRGLPDVDWEGVAGRALASLQTAANELKRLRREMPADALREYDRRYHPGA
jgi:hypothetical protein